MRVGKYFLGLAACLYAAAADAERVPMKLWYDEPAKVWMTSALPVGNGGIGAMFFGGVAKERLQFNDKTLWGRPVRPGVGHTRTWATCFSSSIRRKLAPITVGNFPWTMP